MHSLKILWLISSIIGVVKSSPVRLNSQDFSTIGTIKAEYGKATNTPDVYRLPDNVVPLHYELKMAPDMEKFIFKGQVKITIRVKFTTDRIVLHSRQLNIESVAIVEDNGSSNETKYKPDPTRDIIIINSTKELQYNKIYDVIVTFNGTFGREELTGFFRTSYNFVPEGKIRWLAATQFEPTYARKAFPCFDEPRYRATFNISLARSRNHIAISNMPNVTDDLLPADSMSNGLGYEKFQTTPPMPTYLVAFMVSDFEVKKSELDNRIRVITRPDDIQHTDFALTQTAKLLHYFEGYFGIPYSLPKLDIVAVPGLMYDAMENWGMITYKRKFVISTNDQSSLEAQKIMIATTISHELAHLWFGNLVTPAWYDYLWLKEGFATYFQHFATAQIEPSWNLEEYFYTDTVQLSFSNEDDDTKEKRAMTEPIRKFQEIHSIYDHINYQKSASVLRMLELMLTNNTFQNAIHNFLKEGQINQEGVVIPQNLLDAFDKQVERDSIAHLPTHVRASDIIKTWSENLGYPVLNAIRMYEQTGMGDVKITQTANTISNEPETQKNRKWIVPLTYTTKSQLQYSNLLPVQWSFADKPTKLPQLNNSEWILINLKRSGYYRVNYDPKNWQLLTDQLIKDHTKIHVLNRAQLIDDAFALAKDGKLNCIVIGGLLQYLKSETSTIPWLSAWLGLKNLRSNSVTFQPRLATFLKKSLRQYGCAFKSVNHASEEVNKEINELIKAAGINCAKKTPKVNVKNYNFIDTFHPNHDNCLESMRSKVIRNEKQTKSLRNQSKFLERQKYNEYTKKDENLSIEATKQTERKIRGQLSKEFTDECLSLIEMYL